MIEITVDDIVKHGYNSVISGVISRYDRYGFEKDGGFTIISVAYRKGLLNQNYTHGYFNIRYIITIPRVIETSIKIYKNEEDYDILKRSLINIGRDMVIDKITQN